MLPADLLARAPLAPILIAQALAVRRRAQMLPEPPGPREGSAGSGPPLHLLILGDSSAAGVGASSQAAGLSGQLVERLAARHRVTWRLEAAIGATTADTLARLAALPPMRFDLAVTALGVNDVTRMVPTARWLRRQVALLDLLTARFGVAQVLVTGVPPMGRLPLLPQPLRWILGAQAARLDAGLRGLLAARAGAVHVSVDFPADPAMAAADGFHPSPRAYTLWAAELARHVRPAPRPVGRS